MSDPATRTTSLVFAFDLSELCLRIPGVAGATNPVMVAGNAARFHVNWLDGEQHFTVTIRPAGRKS